MCMYWLEVILIKLKNKKKDGLIDPVQYTSESKISNVWKLLVYLISLINLYSFVYLSVCSAFSQSDKFKSKSYNHKRTMPTRFSIWFSWYVYLYISIMKVRSFHLLHTELFRKCYCQRYHVCPPRFYDSE